MTAPENNTVVENTKMEQSSTANFKVYPSVLERYYTPMYCTSVNGQSIEHQAILFHSNKICLLTIAKSHPIITEKKSVCNINCVSNDVDRSKNKVVGKGKKGGQKLQPDTVLCTVECTDSSSYKIRSCLKGKLVEMNENLFKQPNLLVEKPYTDGHIAILLSDLRTVEECKKDMLDEEEYKKIFKGSG